MKNKEIIGRLSLWEFAILQTQHALKLSKRAEIGSNQSTQKTELDVRSKAMFKYSESQDDFDGNLKSSHMQTFNNQYDSEFPKLEECLALKNICLENAIIWFSQLFTIGNKSDGSVARNDRAFQNTHLEVIISDVQQLKNKLSKFETLKKQILICRDKVIGHADGDKYEYKHGNPVSSHKLPYVHYKDINVDFWVNILEPLRISIIDYRIKIEDA